MDSKKPKKQTEPEKPKVVDEYKERYLRALADYHNLEKRIDQESGDQTRISTKRMLLKLMPFLDNLEKAEVFVKDPGLASIRKQFEQILAQEGLVEIDVLGKPYDPHTAEAIDVVPGAEDDMVTEVVQKGYEFAGETLRPAQVKVSRIIKS